MITKRSRHVMLDIQVMAWDRHKNVAGLNRSIEFNPLFLISDFKRQYKKNFIFTPAENVAHNLCCQWKSLSHSPANEIIPSINRSFVQKAKEGRHVRIHNI